MEFVIGALFVLALFLFGVYEYFEISTLKYAILKAMAAQSKKVDRALQELLKTKDDYRIKNKEFKKIEKIYINNLNQYLIKHKDTDDSMLRRDILKKKNFEL
jgi:hypothetical protein